MTSKERVEAVLHDQIPDRVPTNLHRPLMTPEETAYFNKTYGPDFLPTHEHDIIEVVPPIAFPHSPYDVVDGITWFRDPIIDDEYSNIDELIMPDPDDPTIYAAARQAIQEHPDKAVIFDIIGPITNLHAMRQMDNIYLDVYENPEGLHKVLRKIWNVSLRVLENVLKSGLEISAIYMLDDIASQRSLLFSPAMLEEFLFDYLKEGIALVKAYGKPLLYHSDGNLTEILPRLADLGFNAVNPMQIQCNDMAEFKRLYNHRLTCFGGIDNTETLARGSVQDVRDHVRWLFETVGRDGGLIFATHMLDTETPRENIIALYESMMTCVY